jgi:hypothetical protein
VGAGFETGTFGQPSDAVTEPAHLLRQYVGFEVVGTFQEGTYVNKTVMSPEYSGDIDGIVGIRNLYRDISVLS